MKNIKNWFLGIKKLELGSFEIGLLLAPAVIWFSYYPNFHVFRSSGMNIEFSLVMIYILCLALLALPRIYKQRRELLKNKFVLVIGGLVLWNIVSILWASNPVRAVLTSGVWLVLYIDFLGMIASEKTKKLAPFLADILIISASLISLGAIVQVIYGTWFDWGLCTGCLASGFGFVRPSMFAIEPQFLGNLLIAPIVIVFYKAITKKTSKGHYLALFLMMVAMYLTLSRGAIFALVIALICLAIFYKKTFWSNLVLLAGFMLGSFAAGVLIHATFTELNPRVSDGFYDSVSKSVNQLSLGVIRLPEASGADSGEETTEDVSSGLRPEDEAEKAVFDGYVEKSTDERTSLSRLAIRTWARDARTIIFGVGIGGAGVTIFDYTGATASEYEIVQNEYIETLLERGAIGAALSLIVLALFLYRTRRYKWAWAILIGYLVQWNFFSGTPNSLHIYLILGLIFAILNDVYEKKPSFS